MNKYISFLLISFVFTLYSCSTSKKLSTEHKLKLAIPEAEQKKFDFNFYEALRLNEEGKYDQALECFSMCYDLDSTNAGVCSELGMLYAAIKMDDQAIYFLEKSVKYNPLNWWYNMQLLTMYAGMQKNDKALSLAEKLVIQFPEKEEIYQILNSFYKQSKQFAKAIEIYDKMERITGITEQISLDKFKLYIEIKKPKKGIAEIEKLIAKFPSESRYRVLRGDIYLSQKMPEKAYELYQEILINDPENPYVYVSLSDYYNAKEEPQKAMEYIVKALKLEQLAVEQKVDILGQYVQKLMQDTVKLDETESLFKLLVERYPMEEEVHGYYAMFLQYRKRNKDAISELESMININAKNEQTWFTLIQIYLSEQNYEQVLNIANRAKEFIPTASQWSFYSGIANFQLKAYEKALVDYKSALSLVQNDQLALKSDYLAQIGDTYYKLNKKEETFSAYDESLKANPNNIMVMNNFAYYLSEEKRDLKKAEKMSAKTIEKEPKNSTFLDTYAWIFYQQENYSLAKFYIERAIDNLEKGQDASVMLDHLGDILWKMGDKTKAMENWKKAFETDKTNENLRLKIENKGM